MVQKDALFVQYTTHINSLVWHTDIKTYLNRCGGILKVKPKGWQPTGERRHWQWWQDQIKDKDGDESFTLKNLQRWSPMSCPIVCYSLNANLPTVICSIMMQTSYWGNRPWNMNQQHDAIIASSRCQNGRRAMRYTGLSLMGYAIHIYHFVWP